MVSEPFSQILGRWLKLLFSPFFFSFFFMLSLAAVHYFMTFKTSDLRSPPSWLLPPPSTLRRHSVFLVFGIWQPKGQFCRVSWVSSAFLHPSLVVMSKTVLHRVCYNHKKTRPWNPLVAKWDVHGTDLNPTPADMKSHAWEKSLWL